MRRYGFYAVLCVLVLGLQGCFESKPSNLAVEVMAKRYWQDNLKMNDLFPLTEAKMINAHKQGSDVYIAQVRYRIKAAINETDLVASLQQADQEGVKTHLDQPAVISVLKALPHGFRQNDTFELVKQLQFRNGSRGWLLEKELAL
ncbi:MAG: hypothetical protein IBX48_08375 [Thiomicrospira sp.]|uniref:hypothetical protein n=1 Tax=Thiomicrospira sp. TaxID=935 RepID=UPI0019D97443|nr:hypothetical protein [Thiomicrospira sp.]MBE0494344.1 hypothetical protein [Thiomicrospira sp.]